MIKLRIKLLTFNGAPESVYQKAVSRINQLIPRDSYELADSDPDVLFFLSGGSEKFAMKQVSAGHYYLLIGSQHDNSYASATEVKAWMNSMDIPSMLLDEEEDETRAFLSNFLTVKQALNRLNGKRLGLIGEISDWLISSAISPDILKSKLGITLIQIPWETLPHFSEYPPSGSFLDTYLADGPIDLNDTAKVSGMLDETLQQWNLDALTVECFPLVQKESVTACLPLARFNNEGIPAGCEGDLTAIAGMMLCRELTGTIPWIANINKVTEQVCMFSHCTIAPGLVSRYSVTTHFETGKGTAIAGQFKSDQVTIFRFDKNLSQAFIATADIIGRPQSPTACRTQIEVKLKGSEVASLRQNPLGNHHLIFPGDCKDLLVFTCLYLGIGVS